MQTICKHAKVHKQKSGYRIVVARAETSDRSLKGTVRRTHLTALRECVRLLVDADINFGEIIK